MKHPLRGLLIIGLLAGTTAGFSQETSSKVEREIRIDADEAPGPAQAFIRACEFEKPVRWYAEHSREAVSFEAKTRSNDRKYSIEFDSTGTIEDVEYQIDYESISDETRAIFHHALCTQFEKYVVIKTQRQWTGSPEILLANLQSMPEAPKPTIRYEIVLKGITANDRHLYEVLFDQSGDMLRTSVIIPRNTDHLDY